MKSIMISFSLLAIISSCSKNEVLNKFEDYNISVDSWSLISEIEGVDVDLAYRLHIDNEGILWVGTFGNGLIRIGDEVKSYTTSNSEIPNDTIWCIASDNNGAIWGGTRSGLFKLVEDSFSVFNKNNSNMILNHVTSIEVDQEDNIWFANGNSVEGGLMKFNPSEDNWKLFTSSNSTLPNGIINTIHIANDGTIWTGHGMLLGDGGIWTRTILGTEINYTINNSNLNYNWISHIVSDGLGRIWIGSNAIIFLDSETLFGGVQEFQNDNFISHNPSNSGHTTNRVESMEFDEVGNLWVSTGLDAPTFDLKNEISVYNKTNWLVLSNEINGFPNHRITDIKFHGNDVWMATATGLLNMKLNYE